MPSSYQNLFDLYHTGRSASGLSTGAGAAGAPSSSPASSSGVALLAGGSSPTVGAAPVGPLHTSQEAEITRQHFRKKVGEGKVHFKVNPAWMSGPSTQPQQAQQRQQQPQNARLMAPPAVPASTSKAQQQQQKQAGAKDTALARFAQRTPTAAAQIQRSQPIASHGELRTVGRIEGTILPRTSCSPHALPVADPFVPGTPQNSPTATPIALSQLSPTHHAGVRTAPAPAAASASSSSHYYYSDAYAAGPSRGRSRQRKSLPHLHLQPPRSLSWGDLPHNPYQPIAPLTPSLRKAFPVAASSTSASVPNANVAAVGELTVTVEPYPYEHDGAGSKPSSSTGVSYSYSQSQKRKNITPSPLTARQLWEEQQQVALNLAAGNNPTSAAVVRRATEPIIGTAHLSAPAAAIDSSAKRVKAASSSSASTSTGKRIDAPRPILSRLPLQWPEEDDEVEGGDDDDEDEVLVTGAIDIDDDLDTPRPTATTNESSASDAAPLAPLTTTGYLDSYGSKTGVTGTASDSSPSSPPVLYTASRLPEVDEASTALWRALHHFAPVAEDYSRPYSAIRAARLQQRQQQQLPADHPPIDISFADDEQLQQQADPLQCPAFAESASDTTRDTIAHIKRSFNWESLPPLPTDVEGEWYGVAFRSIKKAPPLLPPRHRQQQQQRHQQSWQRPRRGTTPRRRSCTCTTGLRTRRRWRPAGCSSTSTACRTGRRARTWRRASGRRARRRGARAACRSTASRRCARSARGRTWRAAASSGARACMSGTSSSGTRSSSAPARRGSGSRSGGDRVQNNLAVCVSVHE